MMKLHRYWVKFAFSIHDPHPLGTLPGCGVTAFSAEDALRLLQERVFRSPTLPAIQTIVEDVELNGLDRNHVLPNIGDSDFRGIWFPLGYDRLS